MVSMKQIARSNPEVAATLAKLLPDSRMFAYRLLLEKAKLEEPQSVTDARLKRRTA